MSHYEELHKRDQKIHELEQRIKILEKHIELFPGNIQDKLSARQQAILEYITNNPGTSKQKIIDKLTEENIGSRVTILDGIKDLIENGLGST